jgi:putative alpha-1,2-mannosidase
MQGRIALSGGRERFLEQLDAFFGYGAEPVTQPGNKPDARELLAGYVLGRFEGLNNEPDMDAPWAYHYAGRPDRTAEIVHDIVHQQFGTGRGGLPGNDDSGGLSSWYVWASIGLFPVAGQNLFLVNAPSFREATISVSGGDFTVRTENFVEPYAGGPVQYVQRTWLNGQPLERSYLTGEELHRGGQLVVELGPEPGTWATEQVPPSHPAATDSTAVSSAEAGAAAAFATAQQVASLVAEALQADQLGEQGVDSDVTDAPQQPPTGETVIETDFAAPADHASHPTETIETVETIEITETRPSGDTP